MGGKRYLQQARDQDELFENEGESEDVKTSRVEYYEDYSPFVLDCYYIEFDGTRFGPSYKSFSISKFEDNIPIKNLSVIPLDIATREGVIELESYRNQALQYLACTTVSQRVFSGRSVDKDSRGRHLMTEDKGNVRRCFSESIDGKVIIDISNAIQTHTQWRPDFSPLPPYRPSNREFESTDDYRREIIHDDYVIDLRRRDDFWEQEARKVKAWESGESPSGDDVLLLPCRVFAFVLRTRRWGEHNLLWSLRKCC
jgi:hypothetical protein